MTDIEPGMLVQSKWHAPDVKEDEWDIGLVVAVHIRTRALLMEYVADVIWSGQTRPTRVEVKYIAPLREEQND